MTTLRLSCLWMLLCAFSLATALNTTDPKHVSVTSGQDVGLHCESLRRTNNNLVALWTKEGYTDDGYVFFIWNKDIRESEQHADFHGRVRLIDPSMNNGNVSVIVKNVSVADTGLYTCMVWTGEIGDRTELECLVALTVTEHSESTKHGELTVSTEIPRHFNPTTEGHSESAKNGEHTAIECPNNLTAAGHSESAKQGEPTVSTEIPRHFSSTTAGHGESAKHGEPTVSTEIPRHFSPTTAGHGEFAKHGEDTAIEGPKNLTVAGHTESPKHGEPTDVPRHFNHTVTTEAPRHVNHTVTTEVPRHVKPTTAGHGESAKHGDGAYSCSPLSTRGSGAIASLTVLAFILAV